MKNISRILFLSAALLVGTTAFVSCSDDDDDFPKKGEIESLTGTYSGSLGATVAVPGSSTVDCNIDGTYEVIVETEPKENDEVVVVLPSCSYTTSQMQTAQTIPAITVREVEVDREGHDAQTYYIEEDDFTVAVDGVTYTGQLHGIIRGSSINLTYSLTPGSMPMPINFTFNGTKN